MNLEKKKMLAARTFGVGKRRILFNNERLNEIKEALTKQDMRDLVNDKAIFILPVSGRKVLEKRKTRKRAGSFRKKIRNRKKKYVTMVRKLRSHLREVREREELNDEHHSKLRNEIRQSKFRDKAHFKERIKEIKK